MITGQRLRSAAQKMRRYRSFPDTRRWRSSWRVPTAQFLPTAILVPIPFASVLLSFQRAMMVTSRQTRAITMATALEVGGIALFFPLLGWKLGMVGVTAAALSIIIGRVASNSFLMVTCKRALDSAGWHRGVNRG